MLVGVSDVGVWEVEGEEVARWSARVGGGGGGCGSLKGDRAGEEDTWEVVLSEVCNQRRRLNSAGVTKAQL